MKYIDEENIRETIIKVAESDRFRKMNELAKWRRKIDSNYEEIMNTIRTIISLSRQDGRIGYIMRKLNAKENMLNQIAYWEKQIAQLKRRIRMLDL